MTDEFPAFAWYEEHEALREAVRALADDKIASSAQTRELLRWRPVLPGLIEDLDKGHYFA